MLNFPIELLHWSNLIFAFPALVVFISLLLFWLEGFDTVDAVFGGLSLHQSDRLNKSLLSKGQSFAIRWLLYLNPQRIPWFIILAAFLTSWASIGIACNSQLLLLFKNLVLPVIVVSLLITFSLSCILTYLVSYGIGIVFPTSAPVIRREDLVGSMATVISGEVNSVFGVARVHNLPYSVTVFCSVEEGEVPIQQGKAAIIWDYNPKTHRYKVQALDADDQDMVGWSPPTTVPLANNEQE